MPIILYLLVPVIPFLSRIVMFFVFRSHMLGILKKEELDRETHRTVVLALMGFSFSGTLALFIVNAKVDINLFLPAYYLMISFLGYFIVLNLQQYKMHLWQDNLGDACLESAHLCLMWAIAFLILEAATNPNVVAQVGGINYFYAIAAIPLIIGYADHVIRVRLQWQDLGQR